MKSLFALRVVKAMLALSVLTIAAGYQRQGLISDQGLYAQIGYSFRQCFNHSTQTFCGSAGQRA